MSNANKRAHNEYLGHTQAERLALACDPNASPEILTELHNDYANSVRCAVARNLKTPPEILEEMRKDACWLVPMEVAGNPNALAITLQKLSIAEELPIQCRVAGNRNTPQETLFTMAHSGCERVLYFLSRNPSSDRNLLQLLCESPRSSDRVKASARAALSAMYTTALCAGA